MKQQKLQDGQNIYPGPDGRMIVETYFDLDKNPSMAQQQYKDECDVNNIIKKFMSTGQITHLNTNSGIYGDFTEIPSYQEALNTIMKADEAFGELPSAVRTRFGNDPQALMDYLADPQNIEESIKLGLRVKTEQKADPVVSELQAINQSLKSKGNPTEKA